jgi:hypothetical protein
MTDARPVAPIGGTFCCRECLNRQDAEGECSRDPSHGPCAGVYLICKNCGKSSKGATGTDANWHEDWCSEDDRIIILTPFVKAPGGWC